MAQPIDFRSKFKSLFTDTPAHDAEALLLTCIDFRFFPLIAQVMADQGLVGNFDHVILAGGTLGPLVDFPKTPQMHWQQFFLDHLNLSESLHHVKRVVVLDHRDCGAYKKFGLLPDKPTPEEEYAAHRAQAAKLKCLVGKFQPKLHFEAYLLELPNTVEPLKAIRERKEAVKALSLTDD